MGTPRRRGEAGIFRLADVLQPVAHQYDVILIDCEPGLHVRNLGALAAADYLLVPVSADYLSLKPLRLFLRLLAAAQRRYPRFPHHRVGVLLTRFDARQTQAIEVAEVLKDLAPGAGLDHFEVIIPERAAHRKAAQTGGPLRSRRAPEPPNCLRSTRDSRRRCWHGESTQEHCRPARGIQGRPCSGA